MIILNWNPAKWDGISDEVWDRFAQYGVAYQEDETTSWSTGARSSGVEPGDLVMLLRQGADRRGMVALGEAASDIYQAPHFTKPNAAANFVDVDWTEATMLDQRVHTEALLRLVPDVPWNSLKGSGVAVSDEATDAILELWRNPFRMRTPLQYRLGEPCTDCGSIDVWPYQYGLTPGPPVRAITAGCLVRWDDPIAQCQSCGDDAWPQGRRIRI